MWTNVVVILYPFEIFYLFSGQLIGVQTQETEEQKSSTPLLANINQSIVSYCYIK